MIWEQVQDNLFCELSPPEDQNSNIHVMTSEWHDMSRHTGITINMTGLITGSSLDRQASNSDMMAFYDCDDWANEKGKHLYKYV